MHPYDLERTAIKKALAPLSSRMSKYASRSELFSTEDRAFVIVKQILTRLSDGAVQALIRSDPLVGERVCKISYMLLVESISVARVAYPCVIAISKAQFPVSSVINGFAPFWSK